MRRDEVSYSHTKKMSTKNTAPQESGFIKMFLSKDIIASLFEVVKHEYSCFEVWRLIATNKTIASNSTKEFI